MTLKRIKKEAILYHYFEFEDSKGRQKHVLFDADMDIPVSYGSKALISGTIRNLPKHVTVVYYKPGVDKVTFENPRFQKYEGGKK